MPSLSTFSLVCLLLGGVACGPAVSLTRGADGAPSGSLAPGGGEQARSATWLGLQQDIAWAKNNATQLATDLAEVRISLLQYYEKLVVDTASDFKQIENLLQQLQADPVEIARLHELLVAMTSEIRVIIEEHLQHAQGMEFQCIVIKASLSLSLGKLAGNRAVLEEELTDFINQLSTSRIIVDNMYATVRDTVLGLIADKDGQEVDQVTQLLDKVQADLGVRNAEVQAKMAEVTQQGSELGSLLDWIIAQLPTKIRDTVMTN